MEDEIMTPEEVCKYLKIHQRTLYRMLKNNKLPFAVKIAGSWRFLRKDLDEFIGKMKLHTKVCTILDICTNDCPSNQKKGEF
jgi:excisionase family DNA binding protein